MTNTTYQQALEALPKHFIALIGRTRGLGIDTNLSKAALVEKVAAALIEPESIRRVVATLRPPAAAALSDLRTAGCRLPQRLLLNPHGPLRSARDLIRLKRQNEALSGLEQLRLAGLLFVDAATGDLYLPPAIEPHLPPLPDHPPPRLPIRHDPLPPVDYVCHDLTLLLALLQRDSVSLLHGRWLPPRFLNSWGRRCAVPPRHPTARSELQTGRRRFIHYLAETAGLVNGESRIEEKEKDFAPYSFSIPNSQFSIAPQGRAWLWLNAARAERLQTLWRCWQSPDPALWRRYRLPGVDWQADPAQLLEAMHQALPTIDPTDPARFAATMLKHQPHLIDLVPANRLDRRQTLQDTITELLVGPLVWLGLLSIHNEQLTLHHSSLSMVTDSLTEDPPPYIKFSVKSNLQPDPLQSTLTLTLNDGLPEPKDLMVALTVCRLDSNSKSTQSLSLSPSSFTAALQQGWSPPALLDALNRLAERPLTGPEIDLLRTWADQAGRMAIGPAWLLETTDPAIITRLASTRRGRSLIHRTLSPRAVVVDPARLESLVRRLTEQEGLPPKAASKVMKDERIDHSDAAQLWLMLAVYRKLGQHIQLPVRIPQSLVDRLAAMLSPTGMAGAEVAAEQTLAALQQTLEGRTPFPPWPEEGLPLDQSLPVIKAALAAGHPLELLYYAAGSDRLTRRVVEPYRLEYHGDTPYLIGFCRRAQAERMFRVDRIREVEIERGRGIE